MMLRISCILLVTMSFAMAVRLVATEAANLNVLIVTGGQGFQREPFFRMFEEMPGVSFTEARHSRDSSSAYSRDDLFTYDVVVLYDLVQEITEDQQEQFMALFEKGIGLVVLHHALVSYQDWPEFERIIGGRYPEDPARRGQVTEEVGYQHNVDIPVVVLDKTHPVTKGLNNFIVHDEIYWGFRVQPDVTPLLTTTHPRSGKPLAWVRTEKNSRVVFIQIGHGPEAFDDPNYRKLLAQSVHWAARREVEGNEER